MSQDLNLLRLIEVKNARVLTRQQEATLDRAYVAETGLPSLLLMERAAGAAWHLIREVAAERRYLILLGQGNNAGDGWAVALQAINHQPQPLCLDLLGESGTEDAAAMRRAAQAMGLPVAVQERAWTALDSALERPHEICFIDALYGSGFNALRAEPEILKRLAPVLLEAREHGALSIALDCSSGLDSRHGLIAPHALTNDYTISFGGYKWGTLSSEGAARSGQIRVADLGYGHDFVRRNLGAECSENERSEPALYLTTPDYLQAVWPRERADRHKGSQHKAALLAGSPAYPGAALLALKTALRAGASYLFLYTESELMSELLSAQPELIVRPLAELKAKDLEPLGVLALGPGLGNCLERPLLELSLKSSARLLLDADALNLLARTPELFKLLRERKIPAILTPHPAEFQRLWPELELSRIGAAEAAQAAATATQSIVILKGHRTVIALPEGLCLINPTGNQLLARAGSGDCLTGLITAFLARGLAPAAAAIAAVYIHGLTADLAYAERGLYGLDLEQLMADYLGRAMALLD